jgi:propanol-preferring alcohol dehydrogenase
LRIEPSDKKLLVMELLIFICVPMKAMVLTGRETGQWLEREEVEIGDPSEEEVLVKVENCGVCRTDLHIAEGDLSGARGPLIPGHEGIGRVVAAGSGVTGIKVGERVGVPWLHGTCGRCEYCLSGRENLCPEKSFTGYTANGAFAEFVLARSSFVLPIPAGISSPQAAPLMCSGIIGYRAFKVARPSPGGRIGIFGFGSSAHIICQVAYMLGYEVAAVSRSEGHLELARRLGASEAFVSGDAPSYLRGKLDSALLFAPSDVAMKEALECLKPGGRLSIPLIHMNTVAGMDYERHLFHEKQVVTVEANTRADAREFMRLAENLKIRSVLEEYPMIRANDALLALRESRINGSAVLDIT